MSQRAQDLFEQSATDGTCSVCDYSDQVVIVENIYSIGTQREQARRQTLCWQHFLEWLLASNSEEEAL